MKLVILTDGACEFCRRMEARIKRLDKDGRLEFVDYNEPTSVARAPFPIEALRHEMHVQTQDGAWHKGYFGWIAILRALPRRRWLAAVLAAPPARWAGPTVYRWIARHRYGLGASANIVCGCAANSASKESKQA